MKQLRATLLILAMGLANVFGQGIPWKEQSSFQFAQGIDIKEVLKGFFALQNINVIISDKVSGLVNGTFEDLSPEDYLNELSRAYHFSWYYSGRTVYIYDSGEVISKTLDMNPQAGEKLLNTIDLMGVVAPSSSIRILTDNGIATVSGPPGYVELVEDIVSRLNDTTRVSYTEQPIVKIFPLKYAWAYDTTFNTEENTVTIPGVASTLRGLMETGISIEPEVLNGDVKEAKSKLASKQPKFEKSEPQSAKNQKAESVKEKERAKERDSALSATGATLIQPDVRLNAVIVRDVPARMPQYEHIIATLDKPVKIIEINAAIVDINANYTRNLGNKFLSANKSDTTLQAGFSSSGDTITSLAGAFNLQANAIVNGWTVLSQIQALENDGLAKTLSRPSIVTLDNIEAVIVSGNSFYVAITGTESTDLANVTVNTTLRVTPRVIEEEGKPDRIKLLINITDGEIAADGTTTNASAIPRTSNNSISTQAVVLTDQSLLIGGNIRHTKSKSNDGLPILKDLPLIGYAFKNETVIDSAQERMYLITPRIVNLSYDFSPNAEDTFDIPNYRKPPVTKHCDNRNEPAMLSNKSPKKGFKRLNNRR